MEYQIRHPNVKIQQFINSCLQTIYKRNNINDIKVQEKRADETTVFDCLLPKFEIYFYLKIFKMVLFKK